MRCLALVLATIGCGCGSLPATAPTEAPSLSIVKIPDKQRVSASDEESAKSTVPMTADNQDGEAPNAAARTTHVFWFFGSR